MPMRGGGFAGELFCAKLYAKGTHCLKKGKILQSTAMVLVLLWKTWMILSTYGWWGIFTKAV